MRVALGMCHAVCLFGPSSGIVLLMIHVKSTRFANEWQTVDGFVQKGGVYPQNGRLNYIFELYRKLRINHGI